MRMKVGGGPGNRPFCKIGGGACDGHFHWSGDANGHHVVRRAIERADPGIEALPDKVDGRFSDFQIQLNIGIGRQVPGPERRDDRDRRKMREIKLQPAERLAPFEFQSVDGIVDLLYGGPDSRQQPGAGIGQRHAARCAVQQLHADAPFQLPHRMAQGRGCDAEA